MVKIANTEASLCGSMLKFLQNLLNCDLANQANLIKSQQVFIDKNGEKNVSGRINQQLACFTENFTKQFKSSKTKAEVLLCFLKVSKACSFLKKILFIVQIFSQPTSLNLHQSSKNAYKNRKHSKSSSSIHCESKNRFNRLSHAQDFQILTMKASSITIYNNLIMENHKGSLSKKRYSQISLKKRQTLVTSVIQSGESLTKVAKKLKIKLSTAKLILKKFKKTGLLFNKRLRNAKKQTKLAGAIGQEEDVLRLSSEASKTIENAQKGNAPSKNEELEIVFTNNEMNMQVIYWWNNYLQQQVNLPWTGYYFVV